MNGQKNKTRPSKLKVIPTVFATNRNDFYKRFRKLTKAAPEIQIDIMDGAFVPKRSITLTDMPDMRGYSNKFEAHLMIHSPTWMIHELKKQGFKKAIAHIETLPTKHLVLDYFEEARKNKIKAGLAINPSTPLRKILPYRRRAEIILFLGVKPGREGQKFKPAVIDKIKKYLKIKGRKAPVQVDGGVNPRIARQLRLIGVKRINTGAHTAKAKNIKEAIKELQE